MHLDDVQKHLKQRARERGLVYRLGDPTSAHDFTVAESLLDIVFPIQVRQFYQRYGSLTIANPPLTILPVLSLAFVSPKRLHFATVDRDHRLCFDVSRENEAGQWDLVTVPDDCRVTLTMASFWSNKLWGWIDKRRPIWQSMRSSNTGEP